MSTTAQERSRALLIVLEQAIDLEPRLLDEGPTVTQARRPVARHQQDEEPVGSSFMAV